MMGEVWSQIVLPSVKQCDRGIRNLKAFFASVVYLLVFLEQVW